MLTLRQPPRPFLTALIVMATTLSATLPAAGAQLFPFPASAPYPATRAWRSARVTASTADLIGRHARIYLRLRLKAEPADQTVVQWKTPTGKSGTAAAPDWRALVFDGVISGSTFDEVIEFAAVCPSSGRDPIALTPLLEIEDLDGPAAGIRVVPSRDGDPALSIPCSFRTAEQRSDTDVTGLAAAATDRLTVQPGARGVRLEGRFSRQRIAFSPEATTSNGFQLGGGVASIVPGGAAAVLLSAGPERNEVVVNSSLTVPGGTVFLTVGRQSQRLALGSDETRKSWLMQRGAGAGYAVNLPGAWSAQLGGEAYAYSTKSREWLGARYTRTSGTIEEFFQQHTRVAGSVLRGFQSRASFTPVPGGTANLTLGREDVTFDFAAGRLSTATVTRGLSWSQRLPGRLNLTLGDQLYSSHVARSLSVGHSSASGRRQMSIDVTSRLGRAGAPSDTQLRVGYAVAFGSPASVSSSGARRVTDSSADGLLSQVSARPSFMPYMPMATLDHTLVPKRIVAIDKDDIPESASIDQVTSTVTIPTAVEGIVRVRRNGEPFTNTGQFSFADGRFLVHPMQMEEPEPGQIHLYLVTLQSSSTTVTDVHVRIEKGSVRVASITFDQPRSEETSPDAPAPAPTPANPVPENPPSAPPAPTPTTPTPTPAPTPAPAPPSSAAPKPDDEPDQPAAPADTTPDSFSFSAQTGVTRSATVTSNTITVAGIATAATISVTGGEYSINGGAYTSSAGTVSNGQTVTVRQTASSSYATTTSATLTMGGVAAAFTVTTEAAPVDTTPDSFSFSAQTNVEPSTMIVSNSITVSGIDGAAAIAVSGGEYAIDGGVYTTATGTVSNGQTVTVRQTSSASYSTTTTRTLTIGGVSSGFSVTTRAADTTPSAFSFTSQTNVALNTWMSSNAITVSGIEAATTISVSGGEYSINGGTYTSTTGTVSSGQTVVVRQHSANQFSTTSTMTLTIGGVSGTFGVTTGASDTTPAAFSFTSQSNVSVSTAVVSNTITISGINSASPVSVSGGEYAIQGNGYTSATSTISDGETIKVRVTSSASFATTSTVTLTIGGVSGTFSVTTEASDTTPNAFGFTSETNTNLNQTRTSDAITVVGINSPTTISVSGASSSEYRINSGSWSTASTTVNSGDTLRVRHTSASTNSTATTTTLTIGGVSGSFTTTTKP